MIRVTATVATSTSATLECVGLLRLAGYGMPANRLEELVRARDALSASLLAMIGRSDALFDPPPLLCPDEVHAELLEARDMLARQADAFALHWVRCAIADGALSPAAADVAA